MRFIALAALLIAAPALAAPHGKSSHHAKAPPPAVEAPKTDSGTIKSPPNFDAIFALMDKFFPAQPEPDPARLALARTSVTVMWPDGAYGKMMTGVLGGMVDHAMQLKGSDFAALSGKEANADASAGKADLSIHDKAAAKDPYFDQRVAAIRAVITDELAKASLIIDPRIREGLARSMARRFDATQLADINAFFATPSGHALASQYMQLWVDPDTLRSLFGAMPEMMKLMPDMMQKIKEADDKFPKPTPAPKKDTDDKK